MTIGKLKPLSPQSRFDTYTNVKWQKMPEVLCLDWLCFRRIIGAVGPHCSTLLKWKILFSEWGLADSYNSAFEALFCEITAIRHQSVIITNHTDAYCTSTHHSAPPAPSNQTVSGFGFWTFSPVLSGPTNLCCSPLLIVLLMQPFLISHQIPSF